MEESMKLKKATYHLWTFTISKLISTFGVSVFSFGISFYILSVTGSATSFALVLICSILPRVLVAPFAGYMADKYPKKTIIIVAQICSVLAVAGLLTVSLTLGLSLIAIYITQIILSITSLFSGVTFSSSIANLVDDARIQKAMSFNQMSMSFASIGGPAVGGLLFGLVSMQMFLVIHMVSYIIAVILESTMDFKLYSKKAAEVVEEKKETMLQNMKAGITYLKQHRVLSVIVWVALVINFFFGAFTVGYSFILVEELKVQSAHFGITEGALSIGMLVTSIYLSARKDIKFPLVVSKRGIVIMGLLMAAATLPLLVTLSYFGIVSFYFVLMFSFGVAMIFVNTPIGVMMQKQIAEEYRGRVFGLLETMAMSLMPLAMVLFGFLFDIVPAQYVLLTSSAIMLAAILYMLRPSVMRQAHPDLEEEIAPEPIKAVSTQ
ncbi:MFS transporter [Paenisporosarcina quisquiliarum]|uniref:MFS transporter n=1 Tax=Paenisporosarcina quisquiliarum TaxID=365346 RepID=A0A9X3RDV7_9BACL|nr:MFS transporter [Paenisporosarcina quisquiliarum]MCZ8536718.1 MFS transporter [Paenisporosarcina quisquiliarum]